MRTIISVGTDEKFQAGMMRLVSLLPVGQRVALHSQLPPGSPTHRENPWAFKLFAIEDAWRAGATSVLWCDSSVIPLKPLDALWTLIESQGYWFSKNYDYMNGEFTSDAALRVMGVDRDQAMEIPQVVASCFGLDFGHPIAMEFMREWWHLMDHGAFKEGGSDDPRFRAHRHDQSAAAHVAWKLGMKLTAPPDWFAEEGSLGGENAVITLKRPR